jgi:hypothetical protein
MTALEIMATIAGTLFGGGTLTALWWRVGKWVKAQDWEITQKPRKGERELRAEIEVLKHALEEAHVQCKVALAQADTYQAHAEKWRDERDNTRSLLEAALTDKGKRP